MDIILAMFLISSSAFGKPKAQTACQIEGNFIHKGKTVSNFDCILRSGANFAELKEICTTLSEMPKSLGVPASRVKYADTCPENFQGICANSGNLKLDYYYYKKSPTSLKEAQMTCMITGGRWVKAKWSFIK